MTQENKNIKKVAVIGAGVMGAGIAAQIANSGTPVLLLDIVPEGADNRNAIAEGAVQKLLKAKPAAFMHKSKAKLVETGNIEDDLKKLKECDWVIEAVIERLDIKQDLYKKIEKVSKDIIISSNTSTIPLATLTDGMSDDFKKRFIITHFFNPPRYMRLFEIVSSKETDKDIVKRTSVFADEMLGKSVVDCKDTPGFIANRIGIFWLQKAVTSAIEHKIDVERADALLSRPIGVPKTGVFGLMDLVGLDLMPHILKSFDETLSEKDAFRKLGSAPKVVLDMIEDGYTGRKGKGGFYRLNTDGGKKVKEVKCLLSGDYYPAERPTPAAVKAAKRKGVRGMMMHKSDCGEYAADVMLATLHYAASLVGEIADHIEQIDRAMRLGFNWKFGPFQLIDMIGTEQFARMLKKHGYRVPKIIHLAAGESLYKVIDGDLHYLDLQGVYKKVVRPEGVLLLEDIKRKSKPVMSNNSVSLWDIGDDIACLEFHSKMNSLNYFSLRMIHQVADRLPEYGFKGLVIHNEGTNFSVGANIAMLLVLAKLRMYWAIDYILNQGQQGLKKFKYAKYPVIGAPSGLALGGGCETLLHCDALEAHAETYSGLVEVGVGIIPGWGGCKEMLHRATVAPKAPKGPMAPVAHAFQQIATAVVGTSADECKANLLFKETDNVVMNRDRILFRAKQRALQMVEDGYTPPEEPIFKLPGEDGRAALAMAVDGFQKQGVATPHDVTIAHELAHVLTGGDVDVTVDVSENDILDLERKHFLKLIRKPESIARVMHMLKKGKPLRN